MKKLRKFLDRTGEVGYNHFGTQMIIVKYSGTMNIVVEFQDSYKHRVTTVYSSFKNGMVGNPFDKDIYGVCYLGFNENISVSISSLPEYVKWRNMVDRCYNKKIQETNPSYKDCSVCDEWHNFQNFAKWYKDNYYQIEGQKMQLDKDILIKGNKIYSPVTCCFVPKDINNLFEKRGFHRGDFPIGVYYNKRYNNFISQCSKGKGKGNSKYIKAHSSIEEAFFDYKKQKEAFIQQKASEYKDYLPQKIYNALFSYKVEIDD